MTGSTIGAVVVTRLLKLAVFTVFPRPVVAMTHLPGVRRIVQE